MFQCDDLPVFFFYWSDFAFNHFCKMLSLALTVRSNLWCGGKPSTNTDNIFSCHTNEFLITFAFFPTGTYLALLINIPNTWYYRLYCIKLFAIIFLFVYPAQYYICFPSIILTFAFPAKPLCLIFAGHYLLADFICSAGPFTVAWTCEKKEWVRLPNSILTLGYFYFDIFILPLLILAIDIWDILVLHGLHRWECERIKNDEYFLFS